MKVLSGQLRHSMKVDVLLFALCLAIIGISPCVRAQLPSEKVGLSVINRIKEEEFNHSQVMEMVSYRLCTKINSTPQYLEDSRCSWLNILRSF
jgi:hypothetical protein